MDAYGSQSLNYNQNSRLNFPHEVKQVEFSPMGTFNQTLSQGDIVKFTMASDDYLNPYSTFLELTIDLSQSSYLLDDAVIKNKILQIDSSAQSFISSMVVNLRDKEIERINNYDILAAFLKDVQYDNNTRTQRDYEGNGGMAAESIGPNNQQTFQVPYANDGVTKVLKGIFPNQNGSTYKDASARTTNDNTDPNQTTKNFSQMYTNTSWTPFGNYSNSTYSNGGDINEIDNNFSDNTRSANSLRSDPNTVGLYHLYNPVFANNGFEPWFSRTVYQRYLKNGFLKADTPTTLTFQVPLLSSFFGSLLPPENWKLIPMRYFKGLEFNFTFNPHALFTSWMSKDQASRGYQVKKFSMRTEMVHILDGNIVAQHDNDFRTNGISIPTQAFYYGPSFPVVGGAIPNNLNITLGFNSLRNFFFMFTPNDHTIDTSLRKHYRLSMGIKSIQIQLGTDFYPQQPIVGNGGTNMGPLNNNEFVKYLLKCFNRHIGNTTGVINQHNFAIGCREHDPNTTDTNFTGNAQTGFFLENRVIGKCVYGVPLDPFNYENRMWSGKDTTNRFPFNLNLDYDNSRVFSRNVTMHTFLHHDYLLTITPNDIVLYGRGGSPVQ